MFLGLVTVKARSYLPRGRCGAARRQSWRGARSAGLG